MTVSANDRISGPFACAGGETVFGYDFPLRDARDLAVVRLRAGNERRLALGIDYTLPIIAPFGGTMLLAAPALPDDTYTLTGARAVERSTNLTNRAALDAPVLNGEFDTVFELLQDQRRDLDRSLRLPLDGNGLMPPSLRGRYLFIAPDGRPVFAPYLAPAGYQYRPYDSLPDTDDYAINVIDYAPESVRQGLRDGTALAWDGTATLQAVINDAAASDRCVRLPPFLRITGDVRIPCAFLKPLDIWGTGRSLLLIDGPNAPNGLMFEGPNSGYANAGMLRGFYLRGINGAQRGVSFWHTQMGGVDGLAINGFEGSAIDVQFALVPRLQRSIIVNCGTAALAQIKVRDSTTVEIDGVYVGEGRTGCVAGIDIDRVASGSIKRGAIESCGRSIRIAAEAGGTLGCSSFAIQNTNMERPTGAYVEVGQGLVSGYCHNVGIENSAATPSGATVLPRCYAFRNTVGSYVRNAAPAPIASTQVIYDLSGLTQAFETSGNRSLDGIAFPMLKVDGAQRLDAGPRLPFFYDEVRARAARRLISDFSTGVISALEQVGGGHVETMVANNVAAANLLAITDAGDNTRLLVTAENAPLTVKHTATIAADRIRTKSGADVVMGSGGRQVMQLYRLSGLNMWFEV